MDPDWNDLQRQMGEAYGWNFESLFDPNHVPSAPSLTLTATEDDLQEWLNYLPPEESVPENSDNIK
jgi:hypothetical protein